MCPSLPKARGQGGVGLQLPQEGRRLGTAAKGTEDLPGLQEHRGGRGWGGSYRGCMGVGGSSRDLALATLG